VGDSVTSFFIILNTGTAELTVTGIALPTPEMGVHRSTPVSIAPGGGTFFRVTFKPLDQPDLSAGVQIESDDPYTPSLPITVSADVKTLDFTLANVYPTGVVNEGRDVSVPIVMQNMVDLDSARVFYKAGGAAGFESIAMSRVSGPLAEQYLGVIPTSSVSPRGLVYFVRVFNGAAGRASSVQHLRVNVENLRFPSVQAAQQYDMISIPLEMDGAIIGALADDVGGEDNTQWRLWLHDAASPPAQYVELPNDSIKDFELGRGYWFISRSSVRLDTEDSHGLSPRTDRPLVVTLSPGYHLIGNPFDFDVSWDSVRVNSLSMAEADTLVQPPVRRVAGEGYQFDVSLLEPFEGYWVYNLTDSLVTLSVPPVEALEAATASSRGSTGEVVAGDGRREDKWDIQIAATSAGAVDRDNYAGVRSTGRAAWDPHDRAEPPLAPERAIALHFPHGDWSRHPGSYARDIRGDVEPLSVELNEVGAFGDEAWGFVWYFDVAKTFSLDAAGDEVVVEFTGLSTVPVEADVVLVDRALGHRIDLRKDARYAFYQGARDRAARSEDARFALLVGSTDFVDREGDALGTPPAATTLYQNYPNPFNPSTIIRFELASSVRVRLQIYNARGELVRLLEDREREPGRYEVGWNGENEQGERVSSGVYFCRLSAGNKTFTKKMVLLK
jgi:hypothetical protein